MPITPLPYPDVKNGDPEDVDKIMANINAIKALMDGLLDDDNIVSAIPSGVVGPANLLGTLKSFSLADHGHAVRGLEALAADPTSNNFLGRSYYNTVTLQEKQCIALSPDVWVVKSNLTAADLVPHASRHGQGGTDPLQNGAISADMIDRSSVIVTADPASNTVNLGNSAWADLISGINVTAAGTQRFIVVGRVYLECIDAGSARFADLQLWDSTLSAEVWFQGPYRFTSTAASPSITDLEVAFIGQFTLTNGLHSLRLRGQSGAAAAVRINKNRTTPDAAVHVATRITVLAG